MAPTTRNNSKSKKFKTEKNGNAGASVIKVDNEVIIGGGPETAPKNGECLLLAPEECRLDQCLTLRLQCPLTGTWSCYMIDKDQELLWQIVQYRHGEFASILTPTEILSPTDPFFILSPTCAFALLLPYFLSLEVGPSGNSAVENCHEISNGSTQNGIHSTTPKTKNGHRAKLDLFGKWKCVLAILNRVGKFDGTDADLSTFRLDRSKLKIWIMEKTREVYQRLKVGSSARVGDDNFCREFAVKIMQQQLPPELHELVEIQEKQQ